MIRELLSRSQETGILIQGLGGRTAQREAKTLRESGMCVRAGVAPGRGGEQLAGIDAYPTVAAAVDATGARISLVYVPGDGAVDAVLEAASAGCELIVVASEAVPLHTLARGRELLAGSGTIVLGPASLGLVVPGLGRLRPVGGPDHADRFKPGPVGIVSRSGGLMVEVGMLIARWGWGTSIQAATGGDTILLTDLAETVRQVSADPMTQWTVVVGEPAGTHELDVARAYTEGRFSGPVIALMVGRAVDGFPTDVPFGHATRAGTGGVSMAQKVEALAAAGIPVTFDTRELHTRLSAALGH